MERPFAYNGVEPYIFVSYSHKNCDRVWPVIDRLEKDGYRVWYDDGISPGTEWDVNIADHITHCGYFFALVSKDYLESDNCRDELNFVRELKKPMLLVYLEDVELPAEMKMRLSRLQAVQWFSYGDEESAFRKLYSTAGLDVCKEKPEASAAEETGQRQESFRPGEERPRMKRPGGYTPEKAEDNRPKGFTPEKVRDDRPKNYTPEKAEETDTIEYTPEHTETAGEAPKQTDTAEKAPKQTDTAEKAPKQTDAAEKAPKQTDAAEKAPEQSDTTRDSLLSVSPAGVSLVPGKAYEQQGTQDPGSSSQADSSQADSEWTVENKAGEILSGPDFSNQSGSVKETDTVHKAGPVNETVTAKKQKKTSKLVLLLALLAVAVSAAWTAITNMGNSKGTLNDIRFVYGLAIDKDAKQYLNSQKYQTLDYNGMECEVSVIPYSIQIGPGESKTITLTFLDRYGEEFSFYGKADLRRSVLTVKEGGKAEEAYGMEMAALKTSLKYTVSAFGEAYSLNGYGKTEYYSRKSTIDGYFDVEGYLAEGAEAYKDIAGLRLICDPATGQVEDVAILFTNGGHAEEITVKEQDTDSGRIYLEWKKVVRPYNGRIETDEVNSTMNLYISDQYPYGFAARSGDNRYYYLDKFPEDADTGESSTEG